MNKYSKNGKLRAFADFREKRETVHGDPENLAPRLDHNEISLGVLCFLPSPGSARATGLFVGKINCIILNLMFIYM